MSEERPRLFVVAGASQSGKSSEVAARTSKRPRVIYWDPDDQYSQLSGVRRVTTRQELLHIVTTVRGRCRLAYVPLGELKEEFNFWARCALYWRRHLGAADAVADELADVSTTSKAPEWWGVFLRRGLKRGGDIYAISQRWAEADKTAIGNASHFLVFRLNGDDVPYMARKARIPEEQLDAIPLYGYLLKDKLTGATSRGRAKKQKF